MFEITRYETRRRLLGTGAVTVGLTGLVLLFLALAPDLIEQVNPDALARTYPKSVRNAFEFATIGTFEGFLAAELYQFGWVLLLGLYFAYSASSMIAGDVENDRMDVLLSAPISRSKVIRERFLSLFISMLVINISIGIIVCLGTRFIGEPISLADVAAVHALSIPYLLVCAAIGLLCSVSTSTSSTAQRGSIAIILGLFAIESAVGDTSYGWVGAISPTYHYDPTEILVYSTHDLTGALILLAVTVVLVGISRLRFRQMDLCSLS